MSSYRLSATGFIYDASDDHLKSQSRRLMPGAAQALVAGQLEKLPSALRAEVERYWNDFAPALPALLAGAADRGWLESLPRVWAGSEFVARACLARPDMLHDLVVRGDLGRAYRAGELTARLAAELATVPDEQELKRTLRRLRRRELVRLAWRDLAGWADLGEVMATLSELADGCVDRALHHLYTWATARAGVPRGANGAPAQLVVLGLGKLGGRELNFSSDIDLIFAYTEDDPTAGRRTPSNHEFFTQLGRALIAALSDATEDGLVFRVDMRLRPNGASGPLALSFEATEHYYQTHGRIWERYAFIKARVIAGERAAGERLLAALKPFVYRRYLDYGAVEEIRGLKAGIDRELQRKGLAQNVKLGPGGIREIEFIGQSLQLIRGGRESRLQERAIQTTLATLGAEDYLTAQAVADLQAAYVFLRNTEHRLQMAADRQTHVLPTEELEQTRLAFSMGFASWEAFHARLRRHCAKVHGQFEQMFSAPQRETGADAQGLAGVWLDSVDADTARARLAAAGYRDGDNVLGMLNALRSGGAYVALSSEGRERLDRLMPLLLAAAGMSHAPDDTLTRLIKLIEAIGRRAAYLALLVENSMVLSQLVKLCGASAWITDWLSQHPVLLDELIDPVSLYAPLSKPALQEELQHRLAGLPPDDLDAHMELLREFRHGHLLRVAAADIARGTHFPDDGVQVAQKTFPPVGPAPLSESAPPRERGATDVGPGLTPEQVSGYLSDLAEAVLESVLALAQRALIAKHGAPRASGFCIVAYGRLGSRELSYGSDLDMIFVHAADEGQTDGAQPIPTELFFARLGQRIIHILTARTPSGILYEVDMRLRPSGRSGTLVTGLAAFRDYQLQHAWTWEHQALVRARPVAGSDALAEGFARVRQEVLGLARDPEKLRAEVAAMRARMAAAQAPAEPGRFDLKHGRGGMIDIEFMVQYWVLCRAHTHPALASKTDNISLLEALGRAGLLEQGRMRLLSDAYRRYLSAEQRLKLMERRALIPMAEAGGYPERVAAVWRELFDEEKT